MIILHNFDYNSETGTLNLSVGWLKASGIKAILDLLVSLGLQTDEDVLQPTEYEIEGETFRWVKQENESEEPEDLCCTNESDEAHVEDQIVSLLTEHGPMDKLEISKHIDRTISNIGKHLNKLENLGFVSRDGNIWSKENNDSITSKEEIPSSEDVLDTVTSNKKSAIIIQEEDEDTKTPSCKFCKSENTRTYGERSLVDGTSKTIYKCSSCKRRFTLKTQEEIETPSIIKEVHIEEQITSFLSEHGPSCIADLTKPLNKSKTTISRHLNNLENNNVVTMKGNLWYLVSHDETKNQTKTENIEKPKKIVTRSYKDIVGLSEEEVESKITVLLSTEAMSFGTLAEQIFDEEDSERKRDFLRMSLEKLSEQGYVKKIQSDYGIQWVLSTPNDSQAS